jgi:anaerobic magnesium-protoporphyrin IX monomethyl ester cyclase
MTKNIVFGAKYETIEPLGLLHLSAIAKQEGFGSEIAFAKRTNSDGMDFSCIDDAVNRLKPDYLGFTIYTGSQNPVFDYVDKLRKKDKNLKIVLGGPHATYFPTDSLSHADYVVISEGFNSLRRVLRGEAKPGIVSLKKQETFPISDRENFYTKSSVHADSLIKSVITQTGCPYRCTYCYNTSSLKKIESSLSKDQLRSMSQILGRSGRLFPKAVRSVDDVVTEIRNIQKISPSTKMIFFQDDVFPSSVKWMREFAKKYGKKGLPYHAQMRFEKADPKKEINKEKLKLMLDSGCNGLTFAIESADPLIRNEVLRRPMDNDLMFRALDYVSSLGFRVRTEQMLGLPQGATTDETKVGLEADLETLKLNVELREQTGLPNMAWASIFTPYSGTVIYDYCVDHGFYDGSDENVHLSFFDGSVLNFPKKWVGSDLTKRSTDVWLSENDLLKHRKQLQILRDIFHVFALMPKGHIVAKDLLVGEEFVDEQINSFSKLGSITKSNLYDALYGV